MTDFPILIAHDASGQERDLMLEGNYGNDPRQRLALQALLADADYGGCHSPGNRKQGMEIRIQSHDDPVLFLGELQNG